MKTIFTLVCGMLISAVLAQEPKGVEPLLSTPIQTGRTRAVVVGISDYQDPGIPDLQYAHRDAEAFAQFLRSPAGGSLEEERLKILIGPEATTARFDAALNWLIDECEEGDQAIIYFSGHGDVETKTRSQQGFLLCWDSPAQAYIAGAYPVFFLKEVLLTLSLEKKVRVVLIADACRSGQLAGSPIGGPQLTSQNLAQQYDKEIKILSCQPHEVSLESAEWGQGRGVFSYHLLDGLIGYADANRDGLVSLLEIGRFLEDKVPESVSPAMQMPMVVGNRNTPLTRVDENVLAAYQSGKAEQMNLLSEVATKGLEEKVLADAYKPVQQIYSLFKKSLEYKAFFAPDSACTDYYYKILINEPQLERIHTTMRRNYAAALQDEAQQSINAILQADIRRLNQSSHEFADFYRQLPRQLERAAELLGENHYAYPTIKARQALFEGLLLYFDTYTQFGKDETNGPAIMEKFQQALALQPNSPVVYFYMSVCAATRMADAEKAEAYATQAALHAETWVLPYVYLSFYYSRIFQNNSQAKIYLDKAMAIDSNNVFVLKSMGALEFYQGRFQEALAVFERAAKIAPDDAVVWVNIGSSNLRTGKYQAAEQAFKRSLQIDSIQISAYLNLGKLYVATGEKDKAEKMYLKAIALNGNLTEARTDLARLYLIMERVADAEAQYLKVIEYNQQDAFAWYYLGCIRVYRQDNDKALEYLEKALELGIQGRVNLPKDPNLAGIAQNEQFKALLKKYGADN